MPYVAAGAVRWDSHLVRVLCSTTANDGHFGPMLPFARACASAGHEVRVAAPESFGAALARAGLPHELFDDVPPDLVGPIMATLPTLSFEEANDVVVRQVFARLDAQAALPGLLETVGRWRPDVILRETAELGSLAVAERAGIPHVHVCIGMHEVASLFAATISEPLDELGRLAGVADGRLAAALAGETVLSLVPALLDDTAGASAAPDGFHRFHEPAGTTRAQRPAAWGDPDLPLVYVTFGSVTGSLPPFAGVFREALDALAGLDARVVMTVGRKVDPDGLAPVPANALVEQWLPQETVLAHAAAVLGHGGFGTTMGAAAAGVPQVVAPLFSFDQVVNGDRVAAVGAGLTTVRGDDVVARAAAQVPRLLDDPAYAEAARRVAAAMLELPPPSEAVALVEALAG